MLGSLRSWRLCFVLCSLVAWCTRRDTDSLTSSLQDRLKKAGECDNVDTLRGWYQKESYAEIRGEPEADAKQDATDRGLDLMFSKIEKHKDILQALFEKQKEYREGGIFVGVHSKTPRGMALHILGSLEKTNINTEDDLPAIKDKLTTFSEKSAKAEYEGRSLLSASFSILDTTNWECFIDYYLEKATSVMTRAQSASLDDRNTSMVVAREVLTDDSLQMLNDEQKVNVRAAFEKYQKTLDDYREQSGNRTLSVPFLIKATSNLRATANASSDVYSWADRFEEHAYVSKPFGFSIFEDSITEDLLGRIVNDMKEAFMSWISLPSCGSDDNEFSWAALAQRNLQLQPDLRHRPYRSAEYSQLRIPYSQIYSSDPMFEFEAVYKDDARRLADSELCESIMSSVGGKSTFCEQIMQGHTKEGSKATAKRTCQPT
eukprot:TRINITY_DN2427_c0_g1_i1.p1 TRINITY_DN2427_c0_g1~~TRINITY_DN2427_c0_g1_i1.p1  ORF type:complete len:431 (+),score=56.41 TRINITY_DN2427_c0_g1_i1:40-1332(+)